MKPKRVIITGAKGKIGKILLDSLNEYQITPLDLPEVDLRNYEYLLNIFAGHDAIIHLAWDTQSDNWRQEIFNPNNLLVAYNVYKAALEAKVPRILIASSVHVDKYRTWNEARLLSVDQTPEPDSPYGASKIFVEALGRYYATKGLEVICIRFGGVNVRNEPPVGDPKERVVWFSHRDCVDLVKKCLEAKHIENNFLIIYGVSNNQGRAHDYSSPLGWKPLEGAKDL
ncbi:MAG TPA: NAD(P)-dependent oxidoreductase [Candidatus Nanoarchaeia archaeon]